MQDRIRAIANGLGLQTIIWRYDSADWRVGTANVTTATVDGNYQAFINNETSGTFNTAGGIMLTHELNNYTMQEAINFYPALKSAFTVRIPSLSDSLTAVFLTSMLGFGSHRGRSQ